MRRSNAWTVVAAATLWLTACGEADTLDGTDPGVDVEVLASPPDTPTRYRARLTAGSPAASELGMAALLQKASNTCGDADVSTPSRLQAKDNGSRNPSIVFECLASPWPNRVEIAPGALPPALASTPGPGIRRKHLWGGLVVNSPRDERNRTASLLGHAMRDVYLDECGAQGAAVTHISSALEAGTDPKWPKIHVVVEYRCLEPSSAIASG